MDKRRVLSERRKIKKALVNVVFWIGARGVWWSGTLDAPIGEAATGGVETGGVARKSAISGVRTSAFPDGGKCAWEAERFVWSRSGSKATIPIRFAGSETWLGTGIWGNEPDVEAGFDAVVETSAEAGLDDGTDGVKDLLVVPGALSSKG